MEMLGAEELEVLHLSRESLGKSPPPVHAKSHDTIFSFSINQ